MARTLTMTEDILTGAIDVLGRAWKVKLWLDRRTTDVWGRMDACFEYRGGGLMVNGVELDRVTVYLRRYENPPLHARDGGWTHEVGFAYRVDGNKPTTNQMDKLVEGCADAIAALVDREYEAMPGLDRYERLWHQLAQADIRRRVRDVEREIDVKAMELETLRQRLEEAYAAEAEAMGIDY